MSWGHCQWLPDDCPDDSNPDLEKEILLLVWVADRGPLFFAFLHSEYLSSYHQLRKWCKPHSLQRK